MHSLDIIILRNARAAGREDAHRDHDDEDSTLTTLERGLIECLATALHDSRPVEAAYLLGYVEGQRDDVLGNGDV